MVIQLNRQTAACRWQYVPNRWDEKTHLRNGQIVLRIWGMKLGEDPPATPRAILIYMLMFLSIGIDH